MSTMILPFAKTLEPIQENLKICRVGDEVLRIPTPLVTDIDGALRQTIAKMFYTMYVNKGVGRAANQVGISQKFFIVDLALSQVSSGRLILINPEPVSTVGSATEEEGCISVPGVTEPVKRAARVIFRGTDLDGNPAQIEAEGYLARVLQHEYDHLIGNLFLDRLSPLKRSFLYKKLKKKRLEEHW